MGNKDLIKVYINNLEINPNSENKGFLRLFINKLYGKRVNETIIYCKFQDKDSFTITVCLRQLNHIENVQMN